VRQFSWVEQGDWHWQANERHSDHSKDQTHHRWWSANVRGSNGRPTSVRDPDLIIFSDASLLGWGASLNDTSDRGPWAGQDRFPHINELELMAALFALKSFTNMASRVLVRLMMDNATLVHYVNNAGGSRLHTL
jgi:hypothetical protein